MASDVSKLDLYEYLGVPFEAKETDIRKAYRKKALECHPDKNPDNPKAAETFHILSRALEVLTDASARAAYDKVFKAKKAAEIRTKQLDSKRQKLKADLEQRERDALAASQSTSKYKGYSTVQKSDEELLKAEIDRLREEGSKLLEEELNSMRQELHKNMAPSKPAFDSSLHRIKLKWKAEKGDPLNGGYSESKLLNFLKKYGDIEAFVMSKKNGSALVEFKTLEAAEMAIAYEKGDISNCLSLEWVTPPPTVQNGTGVTVGSTNLDYESLVLRKLRQAEERKRLIEQMQKEDNESV